MIGSRVLPNLIDDRVACRYQRRFKKTIKYANQVFKKVHKEAQKYNKGGFFKDLMDINDICRYNSMPILMVVMGEFKSGKSTFINALLGKDVLITDVTPTTAVVTLLRYGVIPKIMVHKLDGTVQQFPIEMLAKLSAESDDQYADFRKNIYYVEVFLRIPLLKYITIVDTPGFNSINEAHTRATKDFMDNADVVVWVFSYSKAAAKSEIDVISSIAKNIRVLGVINRIDEHDPEEEDLDEFIESVARKIKGMMDKVVGISAKKAREAFQRRSPQLLEESRWIQLIELLKEDVLIKGTEYKIARIIRKLGQEIGAVYELYGKYRKEYNYLLDIKDAMQELEKQFYFWEQLSKNEKPVTQFAESSQISIPQVLYRIRIPGYDFAKFQSRKNKLFEMSQQLVHKRELLRREKRNLENKIREHKYSVEEHNRKLKKATFVSEEMKNRASYLSRRTEWFNSQLETLIGEYLNLVRQLENLADEIKSFYDNIIAASKNAHSYLKNNKYGVEYDDLHDAISKMSWVNEFGVYLKQDLYLCYCKNVIKIRQQILKHAVCQRDTLLESVEELNHFIQKSHGELFGSDKGVVLIQTPTAPVPQKRLTRS